MPRIRRELLGKTEAFRELEEKCEYHNEKNDCTVKAFALVTGTEYAEALRIFQEAGRKSRRGVRQHIERDIYNSVGYDFVFVPNRSMILRYGPMHECLKNVTTHQPDRFKAAWADGETYLLYSRAHVSAVINGTLHDWARGRALRVRSIYRVVKRG